MAGGPPAVRPAIVNGPTTAQLTHDSENVADDVLGGFSDDDGSSNFQLTSGDFWDLLHLFEDIFGGASNPYIPPRSHFAKPHPLPCDYAGVSGAICVSQAPPTHPCIVNAHGFRNNLPTRAPHRRGAYGVPETLGTAAIARDQFLPLGSSGWSSARKNAYINQYRNQISAYGPDGTQIFNGVCDNMGPPADVARLEADYPGSVLFELPGGSDLGKINRMRLELPLGMPCPHP